MHQKSTCLHTINFRAKFGHVTLNMHLGVALVEHALRLDLLRTPRGCRLSPVEPGASSYLRLIDSCITQLKAQGPSRTCTESKEEEEEEVSNPSVG